MGSIPILHTMKCIICDKKIKPYDNHKRYRCNSSNTRIRRYRNKLFAIELLGGKCQRCGWTGDTAAFQFHHKDPKQKELNIGNVTNRSWSVIKKELLKCELLCANCHQIEHTKERGERFLKEVYNYRGRILK